MILTLNLHPLWLAFLMLEAANKLSGGRDTCQSYSAGCPVKYSTVVFQYNTVTAAWKDSGTNVMRVTNYFLILCKAHSTTQNPHLAPLTHPRTCSQIGHRLQGEPNPIILLNGHSIKPTPDLLSPYQQIHTSLSSHQRTSWSRGTNPATHKWSMYRE